MRRKNGFIGQVMWLGSMIIWTALFVALLSRFNWDIIALAEWIVGFILDIIMSLADKISGNPTFQDVTS